MQIRHKPSRRPYIIAGALVLLAASGALAYYFIFRSDGLNDNTSKDTRPVNSVDYERPTEKQIADGNDAKRDTIARDEADGTPTESDKLIVQLSTTVQDDTLYVRSDITGVYSDGTCTLTLTNGPKSVKKTVGIQALSQSSTCQGFNIPVNELGPGSWTANLTVTVGDRSGVSTGRFSI